MLEWKKGVERGIGGIKLLEEKAWERSRGG